MKIVEVYKIKKILFQRKYSKYGYLYRNEIVDDSEHGGVGDLPMTNYYSLDSGHWIGNARIAKFLCRKRKLRQIQKSKPSHCVASIGYKAKRWYGWSHRAICSFGIGDKIFIERYGNDKTPFVKHGRKTIKNMKDAKLAAKRFAASVS